LLARAAESEVEIHDGCCSDGGSTEYVGYLVDTSTRRTVALLLESGGDVNVSPEGRVLRSWLHRVESELREQNPVPEMRYCYPPSPRK
jgi:hypothetical protein